MLFYSEQTQERRNVYKGEEESEKKKSRGPLNHEKRHEVTKGDIYFLLFCNFFVLN